MRLSLWKVFPIHHSCTRQDLSAPSTCWYGLYSIVMTSLRLLFARHLSILCRTYARSWAQFSVNFQVITTVSKTISCYYKIQKLQLAFASFGTKIVVLPLRHTIVYAPMQKQCGDCCFAGEIQQHSSTLYRFICHSPALLFSWSLAQSFTVSHSSSILLRSRRPQWLWMIARKTLNTHGCSMSCARQIHSTYILYFIKWKYSLKINPCVMLHGVTRKMTGALTNFLPFTIRRQKSKRRHFLFIKTLRQW